MTNKQIFQTIGPVQVPKTVYSLQQRHSAITEDCDSMC
jgi:hypothetical protein